MIRAFIAIPLPDEICDALEDVQMDLTVGRRTSPETFHITLAYLHGTPLADTMAWCDTYGAYRDGPFWADRFHLYESHPTKGATRYEDRAEYPLV